MLRTSSAMNENRLMTFSGVPSNLARNASSWVQMPTGQVLEWHCRTMMQPIATSDAVPMPNSSAPSMAAITTSRPVLRPPSVRSLTVLRSRFSVSTWCASARPSSQGRPTYFTDVCGAAPVPPACPEIRIVSAWALATPAAIVPMPERATSFTHTVATGLICLRS